MSTTNNLNHFMFFQNLKQEKQLNIDKFNGIDTIVFGVHTDPHLTVILIFYCTVQSTHSGFVSLFIDS